MDGLAIQQQDKPISAAVYLRHLHPAPDPAALLAMLPARTWGVTVHQVRERAISARDRQPELQHTQDHGDDRAHAVFARLAA